MHEDELNSQKFAVSDEVLALTDPSDAHQQKREKGKTYVVQAVQYCGGCGTQFINIGQTSYTSSIMCSCGHSQYNKGLKWTNSSHFANVDKLEEELDRVVSVENYKAAIVIRDFKKEKV